MQINYPIQYDSQRRREEQEKNIKEKSRLKYAVEKETQQKDKNVSEDNKIKKLFNDFFSGISGIDPIFLVTVIVLMVIGLIMLYSASYPSAYFSGENSNSYLVRQLGFAVIGIVAMLFLAVFDYHKFHKMAVVIMGIAMLLMVVVLFMPSESGVRRWIGIGPITIQASEILKFAVVLFLAHWSSVYFYRMNTFKHGVLPALIIWVSSAILLFFEPHYSGIVIITLLIFVMMFAGGVKLRYFVIGGIALGVIFLIAYSTGLLSYAMERMGGWGQALIYTTDDMWQDTWQTRNSMYAIGSGGLWGLGIGQSRQKYLYLPEPQNDFIFAIVCEELGVIGASVILAIFAFLVIRGIYISIKAKDKFGTLLGIGITAQVGIQVVLNILVITDWLPNTGISLPFFSYGGSSLIMLLAEMGIVLSISKTSYINKR